MSKLAIIIDVLYLIAGTLVGATLAQLPNVICEAFLSL